MTSKELIQARKPTEKFLWALLKEGDTLYINNQPHTIQCVKKYYARTITQKPYISRIEIIINNRIYTIRKCYHMFLDCVVVEKYDSCPVTILSFDVIPLGDSRTNHLFDYNKKCQINEEIERLTLKLKKLQEVKNCMNIMWHENAYLSI